MVCHALPGQGCGRTGSCSGAGTLKTAGLFMVTEEGKVPLEFEKPGKSDFTSKLIVSDEFYQEDIAAPESAYLETEESSDAADVELTVNGNFTEGTAGWAGKDGARLGIKREGSKNAAYISNRRVTGAGIEQNFGWRIMPGRRYKASFWVKYTEGPETKEFILTARKKTGKETTYQNLVKGVAKINEWTEITGTFVISDEVSSIYLFFETQWKEEPDPAEDLWILYKDVSIRIPGNKMKSMKPANGSVLGILRQWNHNPDNTKWSLTARKGYLRLDSRCC